MSGESMTLAGGVRAFRYPDALWEPAAASSGGIFRELSPEDISHADLATDARSELPGLTELSNPARYEYRIEPGFEMGSDDASEAAVEVTADPQQDDIGQSASESDRYFRELLATECAKATERGRAEGVELGREQGRQEGREEAIRQLHAGVEGERNRLAEQTAALLHSFAEARDGYIHCLERESARLALAIAARILRREAQTDPLLLTGAVRVALGQLSAATAVRLCVPAADLALWSEALAHIPNLAIRPEVIGDARLKLGDCRMETELGSADLALDSQLDVLERGFFESEAVRPEHFLDHPEIREGAVHER